MLGAVLEAVLVRAAAGVHQVTWRGRRSRRAQRIIRAAVVIVVVVVIVIVVRRELLLRRAALVVMMLLVMVLRASVGFELAQVIRERGRGLEVRTLAQAQRAERLVLLSCGERKRDIFS